MKTSLHQKLTAAVCALVLLLTLAPAAAAAEEGPAKSKNINEQNYTDYSGPITSYLYDNGKGLTRVEYIYMEGKVVAEDYDSSFRLTGSRTIQMELPLWGGFFAGSDANYVIFGQNNTIESKTAEVLRVVKYSKDWQRLGAYSLKGGNTQMPFSAGSLRCDEYGGYLYIRTCHTMFKTSDRVNHQSCMTLAIQESDMSLSDSFYDIMNESYGYISHSFNQFILVDSSGHLAALDHGDTNPRGVVLCRYKADAGTGKIRSGYSWCDYKTVQQFGGSAGNNATGASIGGFEETANGYVSAYNYDGKGGAGARDVYLGYTAKSGLSSTTRKISTVSGTTTPQVASAGLDGGYILWNGVSGYNVSDTLYYVSYSDGGSVGQVKTAKAPLSDCQPIQYNGKMVWYVTNNSAPTFYGLDSSGVSVLGSAAAGQITTPETPVEPETPTPPVTPATPTTPTTSGASGKLTVESVMWAPPTFGRNYFIGQDGKTYYMKLSTSGYVYPETTVTSVSAVSTSAPAVSVGDYCYIDENGALWTNGSTDGAAYFSSKSPSSAVKIMDNVRTATVGVEDEQYDYNTLVLKEDGGLWYWLSYGDANTPGKAVKVKDNVVQFISSNYASSTWYAVTADGVLWKGDRTDGSTKVMEDVAAVSGDPLLNTLAVIKTDGSLWGWGINDYDQLGTGGGKGEKTGLHYYILPEDPVKIMDNVVGVHCVSSATFILTADGSLYGVGGNRDGRLGFTGSDHTSFWGEQSQSTPRKITDGVVDMRIGLVLKEDGYLYRIGDGKVTRFLDQKIMLPGAASAPATPATPMTPTTSGGTQFKDVPSSHWAADAIRICADKQIVSGVGDGNFDPEGTVSYAQFTAMVTRAFFSDEVQKVADTAGKPWYYPYMQAAFSYRLDLFSNIRKYGGWPEVVVANDPINRYDMAAITRQTLLRFGTNPLSDPNFDPYDNSIKDYEQFPQPDRYQLYRVEVPICYYYGLLSGMGDGGFHGNENMTRAQACVVLVRMMDLLSGKTRQAKQENPVVTIECRDRRTGQVLRYYKHLCESDSTYAFPPTVIDGYTPEETVIRGAASSTESTVVVYYTANGR